MDWKVYQWRFAYGILTNVMKVAIYPDFTPEKWVREVNRRDYFPDITYIKNHGNFDYNIMGPKEAKKQLLSDKRVIEVMERLAKE